MTILIKKCFSLTVATLLLGAASANSVLADDSGNWVQEGPHLMLLMPSSASLAGMNNNPNVPGPYVMWGETPMRHIMVPVGERDK